MVKKIKTLLKLQIKAGMANPTPPIGPALGQQGINIMEFCKQFNFKTNSMEKGLLVPVVITVYSDKSFNFIIKTPPASVLLKKIVGIKSGSGKPNQEKVGKINKSQLYEIANIKFIDMTGSSLESVVNSIKGTAISMGIEVVD